MRAMQTNPLEPLPMKKPSPEARPDWASLHIWQIQAVRDALLVLMAFGLFALGAQLQTVTVPMLVALGLAYLFEPVIGWASRRWSWATRARMVVAVVAGLVVTLGLALALLVPLALGQGAALVRNVPGYADRTAAWIESPKAPEFLRPIGEQIRLLRGAPPPDGSAAPEQQAPEAGGAEGAGAVRRETPAASSRVDAEADERLRLLIAEELHRQSTAPTRDGLPVSAIGRTIGVLWSFLGSVALNFFDVVLTIFLIGFFFTVFSTSWPAVLVFGDSLLPAGNRPRVRELLGKMDVAVSAFVRGRLTISFILGAVFAVGWTICGVPHAVLLGLTIGFCTLVPYLSGLGLLIAWALLTVQAIGAAQPSMYVELGSDGALHPIWWRILLFPGIVHVVSQILDDWILSPIIQGKATNLSPAAIVVAVLAGGALAGLYGMLLAIPAAACIRILVSEVFMPRVKAWLAGERKDPLPLG